MYNMNFCRRRRQKISSYPPLFFKKSASKGGVAGIISPDLNLSLPVSPIFKRVVCLQFFLVLLKDDFNSLVFYA